PLYLRYNAWTHRTERDVRDFVGMFLAQRQEQPRLKFQLAVVLKSEDWLIGNCGVRVNDPGLREGNIGYELDSRHWGRGYATEAAGEIVRFGFEELNLHRIRAWCVEENTASGRVLEKVGMRQEGCLREKAFYKDRWWDHRLYAVLDREWKARNAAAG